MKKPLFVALLCGVCVTLFTALYLISLEKTYRQGAEKVKVIVAKQYIDQGMTISSEILEEKIIPKEYLQPRAVLSLKELVDSDGRLSYITLLPVEKGEQILTSKLSLLGVDTGISSVIPAGKRAVVLVFDSDEVLGLVKPGNRVDITGVFEYRDKEGRQKEESANVLQNILVLSVGRSFLGAAKTSGKKDLSSEGEESGKIPVTFAVAPSQVEKLSLAAEKGRIRLSLRPIGDNTVYDFLTSKLEDISKNLPQAQVARDENSALTEEYAKDIQKKQKEALELLRKYKKSSHE